MNYAHIRIYADAPLALNEDLFLLLVFNVSLTNGTGHCRILDCSSRKAKHIVRFILAAEVYVFVEAFDKANVVSKDLYAVHCTRLPVSMFLESKQLFDTVTKDHKTPKRRLNIDLLATREAYQRLEIDNTGLFPGVNT